MTFWRGLITIAEKEFRHLRRDPYALFLALAIPLLAFLLFGYALETRIHDVPTAVQNLDNGRYSRQFLTDLFRSPMFKFAQNVSLESQLKNTLRAGKVRVAIQIPADYSTNAFYGRPTQIRVWVDGSDAVLAGQAAFALRLIGFQHMAKMAVLGTVKETATFDLNPEILYNPGGRSVNFFAPALCALLGETTTLLLVALSIAKESERGTLDQLRITAIPLWSIILGKLAASSCVGLTVAFVLIGLMQIVFDVRIAGSMLLLCFALVAIQAPTLGLGLILTAEARNQAQALQLTYLVILPAMLLSGLVFPRESMTPAVSMFSSLLPTTWSIQILRGIVLRGTGVKDLAGQFSALAIQTVLFVSVGAWRVSKRLR